MPSVREQILSALFSELKTLETDSIKLLRNPDTSMRIPDGGAVIILRDGDPGEPEVMLSPLTYIYEQQAQMEVMINNAFAARQEISLDDLLIIIGNLLQSNRSMNGLAEWMEPAAPEFQQEAADGAPAMRVANVVITFRYHTFNPLQ